MKMRAGFVSNSSSSSFLVKLPKDFEITMESIHNLMFGSTTEHNVEYYGDPVSSFDLAAIVANDLLSAKVNDVDRIGELLGEGRGPDTSDFNAPVSERDADQRSYNVNYTELNKAEEIVNKLLTAEYSSKNETVNSYVIDYEDSWNTGSILEHGETVSNIGEQFSHH